MGTRAKGERLERVTASPQWSQGRFTNPQPIVNEEWASVTRALSASEDGSPSQVLKFAAPDPETFETPPASGLRITWLGHSSILIEIDGVTILTDPVWGERPMPVDWLGPKRWYAPPLDLDELPPIDLVVISHDHYDHLDEPTITLISGWESEFVMPLGVGAHLAYWGVPEAQITELDWWDHKQVGGLDITCTPARHASGRQIFDQNLTLWAGYAFVGAEHRVFFSGDTGLFPAMQEIGDRLGPFDLTMIEVGAYDRSWPDWHIGPEQALRAHKMLRGELFLPVHWGLFNLGYHGWTEPIERVMHEAGLKQVEVATPYPGQSFEPDRLPEFERWWPEVPWQSAQEHPVVSSAVD